MAKEWNARLQENETTKSRSSVFQQAYVALVLTRQAPLLLCSHTCCLADVLDLCNQVTSTSRRFFIVLGATFSLIAFSPKRIGVDVMIDVGHLVIQELGDPRISGSGNWRGILLEVPSDRCAQCGFRGSRRAGPAGRLWP